MLDELSEWLRGEAPRPNPAFDYRAIEEGMLWPHGGGIVRPPEHGARLGHYWESLVLSGAMPASWAAGRGLFVADPFRYRLAGADVGGGTWRIPAMPSKPAPIPPSLAAARALAFAAPQVPRIESLWAEAIERLRPWKEPLTARAPVLWGSTRRRQFPQLPGSMRVRQSFTRFVSPRQSAQRALWLRDTDSITLEETVRASGGPPQAPPWYDPSWLRYGDRRWFGLFGYAMEGDYQWRASVAMGLGIEPGDGDQFSDFQVPIELLGMKFSDLKSPYEPLCEILSLGFAWAFRRVPDAYAGTADQASTAAVLVAPEFG